MLCILTQITKIIFLEMNGKENKLKNLKKRLEWRDTQSNTNNNPQEYDMKDNKILIMMRL